MLQVQIETNWTRPFASQGGGLVKNVMEKFGNKPGWLKGDLEKCTRPMAESLQMRNCLNPIEIHVHKSQQKKQEPYQICLVASRKKIKNCPIISSLLKI